MTKVELVKKAFEDEGGSDYSIAVEYDAARDIIDVTIIGAEINLAIATHKTKHINRVHHFSIALWLVTDEAALKHFVRTALAEVKS